jgi:hypothetical protein
MSYEAEPVGVEPDALRARLDLVPLAASPRAFSLAFAASAGCTISSGRSDARMTLSAVLPIKSRRIPPVPCVAMATKAMLSA